MIGDLIKQRESNLTQVEYLRQAALDGTLTGEALVNASKQIVVKSDGFSVKQWFDNLEAPAIMAMCLSLGLIILMCITIAWYVLKKKKIDRAS